MIARTFLLGGLAVFLFATFLETNNAFVITTAPSSASSSRGGRQGPPKEQHQHQQQHTTALSLAKKAAAATKTTASKSTKTKSAAAADTTKTMKRAEFVAMVSERADWSKKETEQNLNTILSAIQEAVTDGYKINFTGFGSFAPKRRSARKGRNPQTGEEMVRIRFLIFF